MAAVISLWRGYRITSGAQGLSHRPFRLHRAGDADDEERRLPVDRCASDIHRHLIEAGDPVGGLFDLSRGVSYPGTLRGHGH